MTPRAQAKVGQKWDDDGPRETSDTYHVQKSVEFKRAKCGDEI
jgi:hypothetical protein